MYLLTVFGEVTTCLLAHLDQSSTTVLALYYQLQLAEALPEESPLICHRHQALELLCCDVSEAQKS